MRSIEKRYIALATICGAVGGFISGVAGSAHIWINMIVAALVSAITAYFLKDILIKTN